MSTITRAAVRVALVLLLWRHGQYLRTPFDAYVVNPKVRADFRAPSAAVADVQARLTEPSRPYGIGFNLFSGFHQMLGWENISGVDALRNVGRLLREQQVHEHAIGMEHIVVVDVADLANALARDPLDVELRLGGDFTADDADVRLDVGLARHAAHLVLRNAGVEDRVGNRVGDLVGMSFADRLRREDVSIGHSRSKKKARRVAGRSRLRQHFPPHTNGAKC